MRDNGDDAVINLERKFGIEELMRRTAAARERETAAKPEAGPESPLPSMDELSPLPQPGDPYKAYARPSGASHMLPTLHLLTADGQTWGFPYSDRIEGPHRLIIEDDPGKGAVLVLRFAASVAIEVLIGGTLLDELHIGLAEHRIRWVRELPPNRPHKDDGEPVVRTLIVRPVSPKMMKGWPIAPYGTAPAGARKVGPNGAGKG